MNILLYLVILLLGAYIGYKNLLNDFLSKNIGDIQNYALFLLLFIMGINIGVDDNVIKYFGVIGYQSVVLAVFSIIFSILMVKLVAKTITTEEEGVENDG
ncbi:Membrane protein of unknown function [Natronincola peptidivorans]|uniref:Lysine exporter LysO n=1 Tax=Natronincola peptidivorans TaxID=426128 RepID=A0A1H9YRX6_9FIRM|nr:LysO family transporter [Natronincola peptidivorans]SES71861.1 Membrane protein of unknown function [Natronincola peptidivorans]